MKRLNDDYRGDRVTVHLFHGKKAHHFKHYIPVHMSEEKPNLCVIIAGGNDLSGKSTPLQIANELIEAGIACKNNGASRVFVGSVLPRADPRLQGKRSELNNILASLCMVHNFEFMDNSNMNLCHLSFDGVHLSNYGSEQLLFNVLWYLNG